MLRSAGRRYLAAIFPFLLLSLATAASAAPRGQRRPRRTHLSVVEAQAPCRPGRHDLSYHGGDLVAHAAVFTLFWGAEWQNDAQHQAAATALRALFQQLGSSGYECSLREFELPGAPLGPGTYLGDEIIASSPVSTPGAELSDAAIHQRIRDEVAAHRAPAPTADTIYVVAPPRGVPVSAFGVTGCGGSNFAFCAYHDSFASGGQRFRYAVLPFPCTSNGGTCFVRGSTDPAPALEAAASHEVAETITDPDVPPVGAGAWFEDSSGLENADICESDACLVDLPLGTVNSLWSNLGAGCVASAPCSPPPIACTEPAPGSCVTNERDPEGCSFEWLVDPNLGHDRSGLPDDLVVCADGQPYCDADGVQNGRCTFHVAMCLNSRDPRLGCTPSSVSTVALTGPIRRSTDPADQANAAALLGALRDIDPSSTGTVSGSTVSYVPAAATRDACSSFLDIVVPLRAGSRPGKRVLRLEADTATGRVTTQLILVCGPAFP